MRALFHLSQGRFGVYRTVLCERLVQEALGISCSRAELDDSWQSLMRQVIVAPVSDQIQVTHDCYLNTSFCSDYNLVVNEIREKLWEIVKHENYVPELLFFGGYFLFLSDSWMLRKHYPAIF